jgi:hypothetical protein
MSSGIGEKSPADEDNIRAENRAAQNAAANDKITLYDEYLQTENGHMRYWYVCMAGGREYPCMTAIPPKFFQRKFEDPCASQKNCKFKCPYCNSKNNTSWGVFVEITIDGKIDCLRATVPDDDTLDIKAMDLERKHTDWSTAQALYDAIPMNAPTESEYIFFDGEKSQYCSISKPLYMELPVWTWMHVLTNFSA